MNILSTFTENIFFDMHNLITIKKNVALITDFFRINNDAEVNE